MLSKDISNFTRQIKELPPEIRKKLKSNFEKEQRERASGYMPEDLKKTLQLWNFYNPVLICKIASNDNLSIRNFRIKELDDPRTVMNIDLFNQSYFESLESFWNEIRQGSPLSTLELLFKLKKGNLSYEFQDVMLYDFFLKMEGPFDNCQFFEASKPVIGKIGSDIKLYRYIIGMIGFLMSDFRGTDFKPLDPCKTRPKDIIISKCEKELNVKTEDIPGLNFKNPWRRAIENDSFTSTTIEQAKECLRNKFFLEMIHDTNCKKTVDKPEPEGNITIKTNQDEYLYFPNEEFLCQSLNKANARGTVRKVAQRILSPKEYQEFYKKRLLNRKNGYYIPEEIYQKLYKEINPQ